MGEELEAAVYCRMSLAAMGDTTKVDEQERICRELAGRLGWQVVAAYCDPSASAWQKKRRRPGWDAMLADYDAGKFGAIVVYHGDRLVRRPQDLGKLIDLADNRGLRLASPTGTRNLDSGDDRFILWIEAAAQERSSYDTSRRKITQYERMRREGKVRPGGRGGRSYAFESDNLTMVPGEAAVIREAAERVLAGEGTGSIAADFTARGIVTVTGIPFTYAAIRQILRRPRYAGLMPDGLSEAAWEPVLERSQWEQACAVLAGRAGAFGYAVNSRRYLLSGIAACSECGSPLQVRHTRVRGTGGSVGYGCIRPGCRKVYRSQSMLDAYVRGRVLAWLANPGNAPLPPPDDTVTAEITVLSERRAETVAVIESLADHPGESPAILARALASFDARIAELRGRAGTGARERLRAAHAGITAEEFGALDLSVRRSLVQAAFRITVKPSSRRGPGFFPADVEMLPAG